MEKPEENEQVRAAIQAMQAVFGDSLLAVYLHGSAVSGGLRPQSDIDLLAIVNRPVSAGQRQPLLEALLRGSGRHPCLPGAPRCLEVMIFQEADLAVPTYPARVEFVYGEWLRDVFQAGQRPVPVYDPEATLVLAQAGKQALPLFGAGGLLPEIPLVQIRTAMQDALPALVGSLHGDERNVLLTLARIWRTAAVGDFVPKDAAAVWAASRMPGPEAATLILAADAYLGKVEDDWDSRQAEAEQAANYLQLQLSALLESNSGKGA